MVMLVILVVGALAYIVNDLGRMDVRLEQADKTQQALVLARNALIAWSAAHKFQPGALPCPDTNGDGYADTDVEPTPSDGKLDAAPANANEDLSRSNDALAGTYCNTPERRVGRLPVKTLGLGNLADASGEPLWYALSDDFRRLGSRTVNSDTVGQLTVSGPSMAAKAENVIAIIFAPGRPVNGQQRNGANKNDVAQYLEGQNANASDVLFERKQENALFNDQLILVQSDDLFPIVANVVAKRVGSEIPPLLRDYYDRWNDDAVPPQPLLPFAADFDPSAANNSLCGKFNRTGGLLPISRACLSWDVISVEIDDEAISTSVCTLAPPKSPGAGRMAALTCEIKDHDAGEKIKIKANLRNATKTLAVPLELAKIKYNTPLSSQKLKHSVDSSGDVTIRYEATFDSDGPTVITLPVYSVLTRYKEEGSGPDPSWFFNNEWYRMTYYAVANALLPNGSGSCIPNDPNPVATCLTVKGEVTPNNDKAALLVFAGYRLSGKTQPSTELSAYFEGENADGASVFERQVKRSKGFNDNLSVILPKP